MTDPGCGNGVQWAKSPLYTVMRQYGPYRALTVILGRLWPALAGYLHGPYWSTGPCKGPARALLVYWSTGPCKGPARALWLNWSTGPCKGPSRARTLARPA